MNKKNYIFQLICLATPSFKNEYVQCEEETFCTIFSNWSSNLVESFQKNRKEELSNGFALIERLHKEFDQEVQEAATICLLENIQNICLNNDINPNVFIPYLGEVSRLWWQAVNDFWSGKKSTVRLEL